MTEITSVVEVSYGVPTYSIHIIGQAWMIEEPGLQIQEYYYK